MPASVALLPPSTPCPAHCQAIARMRASNSSRRRMSACHSGSATPNSRGASIATSIRSRCPARLRLPPAVAASARFSIGSWGKRAASPAASLAATCQQFDQHASRSCRPRSGFCLLDRLLSGLSLCRLSHGPGVAVGGVIGRNLQSLGGGSSLQHDVLRDLLVSFLGLLILRLGGKADVSIAPAFGGGHETFVLLLRKLPNYDIQLGFPHFLFPPLPSGPSNPPLPNCLHPFTILP